MEKMWQQEASIWNCKKIITQDISEVAMKASYFTGSFSDMLSRTVCKNMHNATTRVFFFCTSLHSLFWDWFWENTDLSLTSRINWMASHHWTQMCLAVPVSSDRENVQMTRTYLSVTPFRTSCPTSVWHSLNYCHKSEHQICPWGSQVLF